MIYLSSFLRGAPAGDGREPTTFRWLLVVHGRDALLSPFARELCYRNGPAGPAIDNPSWKGAIA
jgi:hypothetical protein